MKIRKMSDSGSRAVRWALVATWTGILFLAIPFAQTILGFLARFAGPRLFLAVAAVSGLIFVPGVLICLFRERKTKIIRRGIWLALLGALSVWVLLTQLQTPAEAIHFFEYGILGVLLFQAWCLHVRDPLIYPISASGLALIAVLDEFLQWLTPGRVWDYLDIRLNLMAGVMVLLFIALVISPSGIQGPVARRSVRWLGILAWAMLLALGASISNTPARVDLYASRIPHLRFLSSNEKVMNEFGYRHVDPGIGVFFSRMSLPKLLRNDRDRGAEAGGIVLRCQALAGHPEYRQAVTFHGDPFLHEMWEHLRQRDHYYSTAWKYQEADPARFAYHLTVALRENQILEKYFARALEASGNRWGADKNEQFAAYANWARPYISAVSDYLVTAVTELELWMVLLVLAGLIGWGYARSGREPSPATTPTAAT